MNSKLLRSSGFSVFQALLVISNTALWVLIIFVWTTPDKSFNSLLNPEPYRPLRASFYDPSSSQQLLAPITSKDTATNVTVLFMASNNTVSTPEPIQLSITSHPTPQSMPKVDSLLSLNRPVKSDVWGNLGPPFVVTNETMDDWLADRWQAAANMQGEPIPGKHWLEVDLLHECCVSKFLIDWEIAHSIDWEIWGSRHESSNLHVHSKSPHKGNGGWEKLAFSKDLKEIHKDKRHVVHEVSATTKRSCSYLEAKAASSEDSSAPKHWRGYRFIRLNILSPATHWGSSVWRFQVWGRLLS